MNAQPLILVVDDDREIRSLLSEYLAANGFRTVEAADGVAMWKALDTARIDLIQGRDADPFERSIDLQVSRVRQKLEEDARDPQLIKTVRNEGYVLSADVMIETTP